MKPEAPPSQSRRSIGKVAISAALISAAPGRASSARESKPSATADGGVVRLPAGRLDALAAEFYPAFNQASTLPPFSLARHGARHDVELRRLVTFTTVPETGEPVEISGLLATPAGASGRLPTVSWQHGTILSFDQVPSNLIRLGDPSYRPSDAGDSLETLFNVHRLAGQGFAVVAVDYLGKGPYRGHRSEAYAVKEASTRACIDFYTAGIDAMRSQGLSPSALFLNGWSQGALNTLWLAQEFQRTGIGTNAISAQSPFNNLVDSMRFWCEALSFGGDKTPAYPSPPIWISACLIVLLGSFRAYYKLDDLFRTAFRPQCLALAEAYWRDYRLSDELARKMPPPGQLLVEGFFDRYTADTNSRFLRQLGANSATYWRYDRPIRLYYGLADEALHPALVETALAAGGPRMEGIAVDRASHRATFLASLYGDGDSSRGHGTLVDWFNAHV